MLDDLFQGGAPRHTAHCALLTPEHQQGWRVPLRDREAQAHYKSTGYGAVQTKLDAAEAELGGLEHAVVLTSHEALMGANLSAFRGWYFCIDEAPNAVQSGQIKLRTTQSREFFQRAFDLTPLPSGTWSEVRPKTDRHRWKELAEDDLLKPFSNFLKHAHRPTGVYARTSNWSERDVPWIAAWLPDTLDGLAANPVRIAGASYLTSLGGLVAQRVGNASFIPIQVAMDRAKQPIVRLHYFTQGHQGSTALWQRTEGRKFIVLLTDFLAKHASNLGFWSANDVVRVLMDHRAPGVQTSIRVAGLNEYDSLESCACIYSAKSMDADEAILDLFPITKAEIRAAREDEDILQYVMRGAIRRGDFDGDYDVYLYNRWQAERLEDQLRSSGIGKVITLVPEEAGFMDAADPWHNSTEGSAQKVMGASGKLITTKSAKRAEQRAAKRGDVPPGKRGPKPKKPSELV